MRIKSHDSDIVNSCWKLPHYSIIGTPADFYLFRRLSKNEFGQFSGWIKGQINLWHKIKQSNKEERVSIIDEVFKYKPESSHGVNTYTS